MEESTLYDLLESKFLQRWKNKAQEDDDCGFMQREKDLLAELITELTENGKKLLSSYALAVENRTDCVHHILSIKILNFGIKIGMDLQKAFTEKE